METKDAWLEEFAHTLHRIMSYGSCLIITSPSGDKSFVRQLHKECILDTDTDTVRKRRVAELDQPLCDTKLPLDQALEESLFAQSLWIRAYQAATYLSGGLYNHYGKAPAAVQHARSDLLEAAHGAFGDLVSLARDGQTVDAVTADRLRTEHGARLKLQTVLGQPCATHMLQSSGVILAFSAEEMRTAFTSRQGDTIQPIEPPVSRFGAESHRDGTDALIIVPIAPDDPLEVPGTDKDGIPQVGGYAFLVERNATLGLGSVRRDEGYNVYEIDHVPTILRSLIEKENEHVYFMVAEIPTNVSC